MNLSCSTNDVMKERSRSRNRLRYGTLSNNGMLVSLVFPTIERTLLINDEGKCNSSLLLFDNARLQ